MQKNIERGGTLIYHLETLSTLRVVHFCLFYSRKNRFIQSCRLPRGRPESSSSAISGALFVFIIVWADVGRHFQSKEILHFLLFKLCIKPLLFTIFVKNTGKTGGTSILYLCPDIWRISVVTELVTVDDVSLHLSNIAHTTGIALKLKDSTQYTITHVECSLFTAPFCWKRNTEKTVCFHALRSARICGRGLHDFFLKRPQGKRKGHLILRKRRTLVCLSATGTIG